MPKNYVILDAATPADCCSKIQYTLSKTLGFTEAKNLRGAETIKLDQNTFESSDITLLTKIANAEKIFILSHGDDNKESFTRYDLKEVHCYNIANLLAVASDKKLADTEKGEARTHFNLSFLGSRSITLGKQLLHHLNEQGLTAKITINIPRATQNTTSLLPGWMSTRKTKKMTLSNVPKNKQDTDSTFKKHSRSIKKRV